VQESPLDFVQAMGWEYRETDSQIVVKTCPICKLSDWKFYINKFNGLWDCKHANHHTSDNISGNLFKLKKLLGLVKSVSGPKGKKVKPVSEENYKLVERAHANLLQKKNAYLLQILLDEWGISEKIVRLFKLGYLEREGRQYLVIPHFVDLEGGRNPQLYDIKLRVWFGEDESEGKYKKLKDAPNMLFRETVLHTGKAKEIILCEGEKDTIIAFACGFTNAVGVTNGATSIDDRWVELLSKAEKIYLAFDGDEAGKKGIEKWLERLGRYRCYILPIPEGCDLADYYKKYGKDAVRRLKTQAKSPEIPSIYTPKDIVDLAIEETNVEYYPTYLKSFNKILNSGFREGQLITLTGLPKVGKTTFSLSLALYYALNGIPTLFYCMEMPPQVILNMAVGMYYGIGRLVGKVELLNFVMKNIPLYLGFQGTLTPQQLENTFRDVHHKYGVKFFVFDNVQYMVRNIPKNQTKVEAIENIYKTLKVLTIDLNAIIVAIAQPKKIDIKKAENMNYFDIAWTGAGASDSDTIVIVHRERSADSDSSFVPDMSVKVDAGRYTKGGRCNIFYVEDLMAFTQDKYLEEATDA